MYYVTVSFLGLGNKTRVDVQQRRSREAAQALVASINACNDGRTARYAGTMKPAKV